MGSDAGVVVVTIKRYHEGNHCDNGLALNLDFGGDYRNLHM